MRSELQLTLEQCILSDCAKGEIDLPSLPDIVLKVRAAVNDPSKGLSQIAKLLEMDPNIAARVIKIANSSIFSGYRLTSSCMEAVTRLGLQVVQNIVICVAVNNLFSAPSLQLQYQLKKILEQSRRVGAIGYVLGSIVKGKQAEKAMLAGLIFQIGALPIISYLSQHPEVKENPKLAKRIVKKLSGKIGEMVLQRWNFDEELICVPDNMDNWFRDEKPEVDYADIIIVANIHSMYGQGHQEINLPPLIELPAFQKLGISALGPQASLEILHEAQEDIRQAEKILAM